MARRNFGKFPKTLNNPLALAAMILAVIILLLRRKSIKLNPVWINSNYLAWREVIIAQSQHETANFTSEVFKQLKNAFGMRCVEKRPTTQIGCSTTIDGNSFYGVYRSNGSSLLDLFLWLDYNGFPKARTKAELDAILKGQNIVDYYVSFLKAKNYFTASYFEYRNGVQNFYRKNLNQTIEIPE